MNPQVLEEWDDTIWTVMVEKGIVGRSGGIRFVFYNVAGIEISGELSIGSEIMRWCKSLIKDSLCQTLQRNCGVLFGVITDVYLLALFLL